MSGGEDLFGSVYERGEVIARQGEAGDAMNIIQAGAAEVSQRQEDRDIVVALLEQGDFHGEMGLLDDQPRAATVTAIHHTRPLAVNRWSLLVRVRQKPELALYLMQTLVRRLRRTSLAVNARKGCLDLASVGLPTVFSRAARVKVAVVSLSTCSGCASVLIDDGEALEALLERAEIVYCQPLMDEQDFAQADVAIVDGLVRSREDREKLEDARRKSRYLVSWGTCATFGGSRRWPTSSRWRASSRKPTGRRGTPSPTTCPGPRG
ncbi:MAG: cyclic nucleotide-binding domain-containing protein [Candidatus Latescibacterota bacterium]